MTKSPPNTVKMIVFIGRTVSSHTCANVMATFMASLAKSAGMDGKEKIVTNDPRFECARIGFT
jgi:hypothetical protein